MQILLPLLEGMPELAGVDNLHELCNAALEIFGNSQDMAFEWLCGAIPQRWAKKGTGGGPAGKPSSKAEGPGSKVRLPRVLFIAAFAGWRLGKSLLVSTGRLRGPLCCSPATTVHHECKPL
jgi:hypothetical protein